MNAKPITVAELEQRLAQAKGWDIPRARMDLHNARLAERAPLWAFVHNLISHPLLALTCGAGWAGRFHDWTAVRAWPNGGKS